MKLSNTQLFRGIEEPKIESLLGCFETKEIAFKKGEYVLKEGNPTEYIGIVLSGAVIIELSDVWGNNSVISRIGVDGQRPFRRGFDGASCQYALYFTPVLAYLRRPHQADTKSAFSLRRKKPATFQKNAAHYAQIDQATASFSFFGIHQKNGWFFIRYPLQPSTTCRLSQRGTQRALQRAFQNAERRYYKIRKESLCRR